MDERLLARAPGPHPTPAALYQARRHPAEPESPAVMEHALLCARCSEELLRQAAFDAPAALSSAELEGQWRRFRSGGGAVARPSPRRVTPYLALAATVAAAALGLALLLRQPPAEAPAPAEDVVRGGEVESAPWSPTGRLVSPPRELHFPGGGGAGRQVMIFDAARTFTWTSEPTTGDRVALPPDQAARLLPGVEYYWLVLGGREEAARRFVVEK